MSLRKSSLYALLPIGALFFFLLGSFLGKPLREGEITAEVVQLASRLSGLTFNEAETDSMLSFLDEHRNSYQALRSRPIPNHIPPALYFNPLVPGAPLPTEQAKATFAAVQGTTLPTNHDDLAFYTIPQLADLLKNRKISSEELTRFFINRLKRYDSTLHCVVSLTEELALQQARRADAEIASGTYKGPLHGIPYGAKDLLATKNYKTTWGSVIYKDQLIDQNATVIRRLEEAGAVLVAKLTLGELAWGDVWFGGITRNPWNPVQGSSGSSAGSASAVAAGLVPFAIGTETLGSIVSPSTVCGTTGLRPTFGRVSRAGAMALSWSMDKIGPIARSVEDCAIVFQSINGPDGIDLSVQQHPFAYRSDRGIKGLRVGYLHKDFARNYPFRAYDSLALYTLRQMGIELIPMELPDYPVGAIRFVLDVEAAAAFDDITRNNQDDLMVRQVKQAWPNLFRAARFIPAVEYVQANRLRYQLMEEMALKMKDIDVYVAPSWAGANLTLTNLTGHPCVVVPNGFSPAGTPVSISFTGRLFGEASLLSVAKAYQEATTHHQKHPSLK
jgi:Asp-tRNA(Asn)/Glu-tRNA(Gln) amidotransferase A subunit family amidase